MQDWIKHPVILRGQTVDLLPLEKSHFDELQQVAKEKRIWEFLPGDGTDPEKFSAICNEALSERENGNHYPFVIFHKGSRKLIGSTRFLDIVPKFRKLEIGWTWLHPDHWGTTVNFECKLLLLTHCFETLKTIRVQIKTGDNNLRSRKAIEKLGAQFEGILRKERIRENGTIRNTANYSIIDDEWESVRTRLTYLLADVRNGTGKI
jgi:RimJ/RimL family protein N-acetyltransferase